MSEIFQNERRLFEIHELDLSELYLQMSNLGIASTYIYGIGENCKSAVQVLSNMRISVSAFVDLKAETGKHEFLNTPVISPKDFISDYCGDYILVTPSIFLDIVEYLSKNGIPNNKILTPFYKTETIEINYGYSLSTPSINIDYCDVRPENPDATFLTIAYNTPEYMFRRAIESVLRQTYKNFMYVIIINGATDNTLAIANEYKKIDKRLVVIDLAPNYVWTDLRLIDVIKSHIYGRFWCQLDADDYYDSKFLEISLNIAMENSADIVCVRTMAFCDNSEFNIMTNGFEYDNADKYWLYYQHPPCHLIGQHNIMRDFAKGYLSGTFWGKLYATDLMIKYVNFLTDLDDLERGTFFRLDTAMTYKILSMSERVFFSDKVLHYASYSKKSNTYSDAPAEWLMSLWFTYKAIKLNFYTWYKKDKADSYCRRFLNTFLPWMVTRRGVLKNFSHSPHKDYILKNIKDIYKDMTFMDVLFENIDKKEGFREFYNELKAIVNAFGCSKYINLSSMDQTGFQSKRIIGYGAKGENASRLLPRLINSQYCPTELWDIRGDNRLVKTPNFDSLSDNDIVLVFPTKASVINDIRKKLEKCMAKIIYKDEILRLLNDY